MNTYYIVAMFFGITTVLYLLGYQPILFEAIQKYENLDGTDIFNLIIEYALSWNGAFSVIAAVATVATFGLNLLAIVPFALLFILLDFVVFPTTLITSSGFPFEVQLLIGAFFALTKILIVISFLRSGE